GPYAQLEAEVGPAKVGLKAFAQSGAVDPLRPLVTAPVHVEMQTTSGSVFYLAGQVVEGSELVRVELRDGLTGLPLSERHLQRGRDYELDWLSGRLLLARPLSFLQGPPALGADALSAGVEPVLVVDYERALLGPDGRQTVGGGASVAVGPVQLSGGAVRELQGTAPAYTLLRARGSAALGPLALGVEAAHSEGEAVAPDAFLVSDDGGLTAQSGRGPVSRGDALSVWLRGKGLFDAGHVDAAFRYRSPGFSDRSHRDQWLFRQISLRVDQPIGDLRVGALADVRASADPRVPFGDQPIAWRVLGASAGYRFGAFEARVEAKDSELTAAPDPVNEPPILGGRTSAGASLTWKALPELSLTAGHVQSLATRGGGLGALPDTFSSVGAELALPQWGTFGARAGWGPALGPQVWAHGERRSGGDWYYGSYSVDVDGPSLGQGRAVSGARAELGGGASAFVEDVATHDAASVRMARAVGVAQQIGTALQLEARYERGAHNPLGVPSGLARDAAGVSATFIQPWLRLFARAEVRLDRGPSPHDPTLVVDLEQHLISAAAEAELPLGLQLSGRVNLGDTVQSGARAAGFLEGTSALAYRSDAWMAVLRYSLTREQPPGGIERVYSIASLVPALRVADRVTLWGGLHAGWSSEDANQGMVLSASVRPAVQVVGGLELSAEVARRSSAPLGGELTALRGEAGWRFGDRTYVGAGYTLLGFSGTGVTPTPESNDRLYLRAELAL
ncbi:MAG TPA: flagellar motor protein, partial [Myxococcales bacterium]|nr:flagellar motor protein [Myxococcales bacterium]